MTWLAQKAKHTLSRAEQFKCEKTTCGRAGLEHGDFFWRSTLLTQQSRVKQHSHHSIIYVPQRTRWFGKTMIQVTHLDLNLQVIIQGERYADAFVNICKSATKIEIQLHKDMAIENCNAAHSSFPLTADAVFKRKEPSCNIDSKCWTDQKHRACCMVGDICIKNHFDPRQA